MRTTVASSQMNAPESMSQVELSEWLRSKMRERSPAAMVRFGDAEAQLLAVDSEDAGSMGATITMLECQSGLSLASKHVLKIRELIELAFDRADVLGIAPRPRGGAEHTARMRTLADRYAERVAAGRPVALASCMANDGILDALPELLRGRRVGVISCRDVKPVLEGEWKVAEVVDYQMPSQYQVRDVDGAYEATMHDMPIWPDAHVRAHAKLTVREPGEVFLVAVGPFGKDLCVRVRELGGIALDMGSALDRLAGKVTRGPRRRVVELHASGMPAPEIAASLSKLYGFRISPEKVSRVIAELART